MKKGKTMISLKDFIINELETYHIPVNKKNLAKLRSHFTKELKYKKLWDQAPTKLVERSKTKTFKKEDLEAIAKSLSPYLINLSIKASGLDPKKIEALQKKHQQKLDDAEEEWITYISTHSQRQIENDLHNDPTPKLSTDQKYQALNFLMTQAIFDRFFTMTKEQKDLYLHDFASTKQDSDLTYNDKGWIIAQERLKKPEKYYYSRKDNIS